MCLNCMASFLVNPINLSLVIISFIASIILLVVFIRIKRNLSNTKKLAMVYGSIFFFVFPFVFFFYGKTCQNSFISCGIYGSVFYSTPIALGISLLLCFITIPFIYKFSFKSKRIDAFHPIFKFIQGQIKILGMKMPKLYVIDKAEPIAFSFSHISPRIFISVGLTELLNKKELESVLLHELGHIKQRSSYFKFTNMIIKIFSPVSNFYRFHEELSHEEKKADDFAIKIQKTDKYLHSTKVKMRKYFKFL